MKMTLYKDNTIDVDLNCIISNLNRFAPNLRFHEGKEPFEIKNLPIINPITYQQISTQIDQETQDSNEVYLFTELPYDNNFFWDTSEKKVIISVYGWDSLTNLPRNNGVVYFICAILIRLFSKTTHETSTGCINDFWRDKTGVDVGMRAAYICPECMQYLKDSATPQRWSIIEQVQKILHELSIASRANQDICTFWEDRKTDIFDVFICHNSNDKNEIRTMNERLKISGINTWFDEEQLPPGRPWQELLEENIDKIKTAAVFVGSSGIGPWQNMELRAFLEEFVRRKCPVIPVILSSCGNVPQLPLFLRQLTWVDFRKSMPDPFIHLLWGITGKKPK